MLMSISHPRYIQKTLNTQHGCLTLTIFTPADALWICDQVQRLPDNLHGVQSGIIDVGASFIVLEREVNSSELRFLAQCYRPSDEKGDALEEPELTVLEHYPTIHCS